MAFNVLLLMILGISGFALFYLIIRMKDLSGQVLRMNERLPLTDEMRKQASSTIESLNERMGSLNQKALMLNNVMNEVTALRNLFIMPKGAGSAGERLLEKALSDVLQTGMYQTASEVVREALRLLKERDETKLRELRESRGGVSFKVRGEGRDCSLDFFDGGH